MNLFLLKFSFNFNCVKKFPENQGNITIEMKKNIPLIKQAGVMTALLGGAIASCAGPAIVGAVLGGVLTNILSNKIEQSSIKDIQKILSRPDPSNLNHDLEKLIQKAMVWATENICYAYNTYCLSANQKKILKNTQQQIINQINSINKNQWQASNELINEIDSVSDSTDLLKGLIADQSGWSEINPVKPFPVYYETHFVENFKLCFGELLKDPKNEAARQAYKRNISTQLQQQLLLQDEKLDSLLQGNKAIQKQLVKIARSPVEYFEQQYIAPEINIVLDDYLKPLHDDVLLLVGINGEVLVGIEAIKKETEHQTQKIEVLGRKVEKSNKYKIVYIIIISIAVPLISYLAYQYSQSKQPFALTINVTNGSQNQSLTFYEPQIKITSGDTEDTKQSQEKRVVFNGLPSSLRKDSIRVQIESYGFQRIDTTVAKVKNLNLALYRDNTYRFMKGRVKDFLTGNAIENAQVRVKNIVTQTDKDGWFLIDLPETIQQTEQRLIITKDKYQNWERIEPVTNQESIILLKTNKL